MVWLGASGSGTRGWFSHVQSRFVGKPAMTSGSRSPCTMYIVDDDRCS